jgi:hypothetical protein
MRTCIKELVKDLTDNLSAWNVRHEATGSQGYPAHVYYECNIPHFNIVLKNNGFTGIELSVNNIVIALSYWEKRALGKATEKRTKECRKSSYNSEDNLIETAIWCVLQQRGVK